MSSSGSTPTPPGDEALLRRAREGDGAAFTELRAAHLDSARGLAAELVEDTEVEQLLAESFDRIQAQLQAGRGPKANFRGYLQATIRDRHRDLLRNRRLDQEEAAKPRNPATAPPAAGGRVAASEHAPPPTTTPAAPPPPGAGTPTARPVAGRRVARSAPAARKAETGPGGTEPSAGAKAARAAEVATVPAAVARAAEGDVPQERQPLLDRFRGLAPQAALMLRGLSSRTAVVAGAALLLCAASAALWIGIQTNDTDEPRADQVIVDPTPVEDPELREGTGEVPFLAPLTEGLGSPTEGPGTADPSELPSVDPSDPFPLTPGTELPGTEQPPENEPPGPDAPSDDPSSPEPALARPEAPSASPITSCGSYGSLTVPRTTGVRYAVVTGDGRQGPWEVRASAADGYALAPGSQRSFSGNLGDHYACPSIRSVGKSNVGRNNRGRWQIALAVDAPGPGPRTLEARFVFDRLSRVHGAGGGGWDCGGARTVGAGSPVTCTVVVDGGSPATLVLTAERLRLLGSTEPTGSVTLHEGGAQRGSAGF